MKYIFFILLVLLVVSPLANGSLTMDLNANGGSINYFQSNVIENAFGNPIRFNGTTNGTYTVDTSTSAALTIGRSGMVRSTGVLSSSANSIQVESLVKAIGPVNAFDEVGMMNSESAKPPNLCDENDLSVYGISDSSSRYPDNQVLEGEVGIMGSGTGDKVIAYKSGISAIDTDVSLDGAAQMPRDSDRLAFRMQVDALKGFDQSVNLVTTSALTTTSSVVNNTTVYNTTYDNSTVCDTSALANLHLTSNTNGLMSGNASAYGTSSISFEWTGTDFKDSFNEEIEQPVYNNTTIVNRTTNSG